MASEEQPEPATPVKVTHLTARTDDDAIEGEFVNIVDGPHQGLYGTFDHPSEHDPKTGYPSTITVRPRHSYELVVVDYAHARRGSQVRR